MKKSKFYFISQTANPKSLSYIQAFDSGTNVWGITQNHMSWIFTTRGAAEAFKQYYENYGGWAEPENMYTYEILLEKGDYTPTFHSLEDFKKYYQGLIKEAEKVRESKKTTMNEILAADTIEEIKDGKED